MKLRTRKLTSVILAVLMVVSAVFGVVTTATAADSDTITYQYIVTCDDEVVAFEGELSYPSALSVESVVVYDEGAQSYYRDNGKKIIFNATNVDCPFNFTDGAAMLTVKFNVNGDFDKKGLDTVLSEFYSRELINGGNLSYRYANVIDGEVVTSGTVDIDNPENNTTDPTTEPTTETEEPTTEPTTAEPTTEPTTVTEPVTQTEPDTTIETDPVIPEPEETTYTVIYNYNNGTEDTFLTRTYKTAEKITAEELANACYPSIRNPYNKYSIGDVSFVDENVIEVNLKSTPIEYTVTLNDEEYSTRRYMEVETITTESEVGFKIDGNVVAVGTTFKFFVTGNMDIVTEETAVAEDEFASITFNSLAVSEQRVMMQLLATTKVSEFSRMGVAFATSECEEDAVKEAVLQVTEKTNKADNGVVVHNSAVELYNESGQYQFVYAPYIDVEKVEKSTKIYFYAYVVKPDGTIYVSDAAEVTPYDAIA
ncbi:MAG: hypothetical protein J1E41_00270 [Ruminococcus sp.]|nr:hypothetical protein [Ruminococcus sp.]